MKPKKEFYISTDLKERGWTSTMINKFLPKHDEERTNPMYKCAAPMKLYSVKRVKMVESTKAFKEALSKSAKRKEVAMNGVETKRQRAINYAESVIDWMYNHIDFPTPLEYDGLFIV